MARPKTIAELTHTCRYCKSMATHVSKRTVARTTTTYYFYCDKHKTPNALALGERRGPS
jgi:hypothetical protein